MTSPTILDKMTCAWCDANGSQQKCYRCKDGCRQPNLAERPPNGTPRRFNMNVTPTNSFLPRVTRRNGPFVTVNGCCSSIVAEPEFGFPDDRSDAHGSYKVLKCAENFPYPAYACVQGWRRIALITSAKLYISRTQPRYGCGEENQCSYRLSLVIDGEIGVTWATQCRNGESPPVFDPNLVSVTLHAFRQVFRRSVSQLEFPMVFNTGNSVSVACGPQCAESFSGFTPTFSDPPDLSCNLGAESDVTFHPDNSKPNPTLPTEYTVELW